MTNQKVESVQQYVDNLPNEIFSMIMEIVNSPTPSEKEIYQTLIDWGKENKTPFIFGFTYVKTWVKSKQKVGSEAVTYNKDLEKYQGADLSLGLARKVGATMGRLLDKGLGRLEEEGVWEKIPPAEILKAIPGIVREQNNTLKIVSEFQQIKDKKDLVFAGAYRMQQEILDTFKDNPLIYEAVQEAARAAMLVIEEAEY
jgi:hypothetical protein